jgi:type IV pilus assembly protein PilC
VTDVTTPERARRLIPAPPAFTSSVSPPEAAPIGSDSGPRRKNRRTAGADPEAPAHWWQRDITPTRIKRDELMNLSRQLAAFIKAGITILDAIALLAGEAGSKPVRRVLGAIEDDIRGGATLSDAVDQHPQDFPDFYRGILRSAELTGRLDTVLDQLSTYLERDLVARKKIKSAMIYPAVVLGLSMVTVCVLAIYVLPKFKVFFKSLGAKLPLPTRMLLAFTDFLGTYWWALLLGVFVTVGLVALTQVGERGRMVRDKLILRMPIIGETVRYALVERFCRMLASMVDAGVPLPAAMSTTIDSLRNLVYRRGLGQARVAMLEGDGLAAPIAATGLFPGTAVQMLRVGESTGSLDQQLESAAEYFGRELDYKINRLTTLFEPIVITVMGVIVGFVAVAFVSAMYGIFRQVKA